MPKVDLSDEALDAAQALFYRKWSEAFDALKRVKAEKDDGSDDWAEFHAIRLHNANSEFDKWVKLRAEIDPIAPLTKLAREIK